MTCQCAIPDGSWFTVPADSLLIGHAYPLTTLYINQYNDGGNPSTPTGRLTAIGSRYAAKGKFGCHKKTAEKALIPLPPTGFASLFCAKARAVQSPAVPKPAAGPDGVVAIARSARFCKKEQRRCSVLRSVEELACGSRRPASRDYDLKNLLHRLFSFSELIAPAGNSAPAGPLAKRLKGSAS